ncbi:uncharacterized protein LOC144052393 [Vanacampus margaritifer]
MGMPTRALLFLILQLVTRGSAVCPRSWKNHDGQCYFFSSNAVPWEQADVNCRTIGGHLASIWDKDEQSWLSSQTEKQNHWIGLTDTIKGGHWTWTDGSPFIFKGWFPGQPNNLGGNEHCGLVEGSLAQWHDYPCSRKFKYICKRASDETRCPPPPTCPPPTTCPTLPTGPAPTSPTLETSTAATPTNWEPEICTSSAGQQSCSSHDITCSCLLAMAASPRGGFKGVLSDGLSVNRSIAVRGQANLNTDRVIVNLLVRDFDADADGEDDDVTALHLKLDFGSRTITHNSKVDNLWGQKQSKEFSEQSFPFGPGLYFKIVIRCDADAFHMTFNDIHLMVYNYKVRDLRRVKWLEAWHASLTGIQLM